MGAPSARTMLCSAALAALAAGCAPYYVTPPSPREEPVIRVAIDHHADSFTIKSETPVTIRDTAHQTMLQPSESWTIFRDSMGLWARTGKNTVVRGIEGVLSFQSTGAGDDAQATEIRPEPDSGLVIIRPLPLERYLVKVVSREIGNVRPERLEAAKAQAVASRSYALSRIGDNPSRGYDIESDVTNQAFEPGRPVNEVVKKAVEKTRGQVLMFNNLPIDATYSSCCGGRTAWPSEVWGAADSTVPFVASVEDPFCVISHRYAWADTLAADSILKLLYSTDDTSLVLRDVIVQQRGSSGRAVALRISTSRGDTVLYRDRIRAQLGDQHLPSTKFDLACHRDSLGNVDYVFIAGNGLGHGVGMCQWGAMGMAEQGWGYKRILGHFYRNARIKKFY